MYDELFRQVPDHPQLTRKANPAAQREATLARLQLLKPFLRSDSVFMEIGPGDCSLAIAIAEIAKQVWAVDVSAEITKRRSSPSNFRLVLSDGAEIPLPADCVDVAFSYQLIEHLHPIDAQEHIANVHRVLRPGGIYVCVTPNRLTGPHDISKYFDERATGFHMKEYTHWELIQLLGSRPFRKVRPLLGVNGRFFVGPSAPLVFIERALSLLPHRLRRKVGRTVLLRTLLGGAVMALK